MGPWLSVLAVGCGGSADPAGTDRVPAAGPADPLTQLDRLAFVESGSTARGTALTVGSDVDLLVDRFEVTWETWDTFAPDPASVPDFFRPERRFKSPDAVPVHWMRDVPVAGVTLREAEACADARGMRLPTFEEWMWCALGTFARRFPSGRNQVNVANTLELDLGAPTPVGAFEAGRTPDTGIFDLVGNVWEWVRVMPEGPSAGWSVLNADAWASGRWRSAEARCMGGSHLARSRPLYEVRSRLSFSIAANAGHRASDTGFRCVAPARAFLVAWAGALERGVAAREDSGRARAIGRRWGGRSAAALEDALREVPDGSAGAELLRELLAGARGDR